MIYKTKDKKYGESTIYRCLCHDFHFLEVMIWADNEISFNLVDLPNTFLTAMIQWWKNRKIWVSEVILERSEIEQLRDSLTKYLDKTK